MSDALPRRPLESKRVKGALPFILVFYRSTARPILQFAPRLSLPLFDEFLRIARQPFIGVAPHRKPGALPFFHVELMKNRGSVPNGTYLSAIARDYVTWMLKAATRSP